MNNNEIKIMGKLKNPDISVCRVTKPSRKPAAMKIGTIPINIFNPSFAPRIND